jgi:hypothetical protein
MEPSKRKGPPFNSGPVEVLLDYQPRSRNSSNVRSCGTVTEWVRSSLIAGSINWFGVAISSQCEMVDPGCTGFGIHNKPRPLASAPARMPRSSLSVPLTPPANWRSIVVPCRLRDHHCGNREAGICTSHTRGRRLQSVVHNNHADCACILCVLCFRNERTTSAVQQCDVSTDRIRIG